MRVHFASPIDQGALERLSARFDVSTSSDQRGLEAGIRSADILGFRSGIQVHGQALRAARHLKLLVRAGSGLDNVDVDVVRSEGMRLVRIPGPGAQAVAEMTIGLILAVSRRIVQADRTMRLGEWNKHELTGRLVSTRTLGIVGVGSIGSRVALLGSALGMRVVGCSKNGNLPRVAGVEYLPTEQVAENSDIVSLHVPLDASTRHMVDATFLARMRPGSILVNTARGDVVDESALVEALASGHLAGAALDVHASEGGGMVSPLARFESVVMTPHIGAMAHDSQIQIGNRAIALIDAFLEDRLEEEAAPEELVV